ncbi:type II toxin-antitoxin system RelE/ParE family toxin [bacterium]|nr:type II toxin-antitoxin system RelE/ParE family toxin [bacterium]MBT4551413.1 type II toxin-antitoxin system RelE/ParE family toxin [bacterium]MBT7088776.1 type II toxin-antitoxin system RelE/ParE family toxin [bacterium]
MRRVEFYTTINGKSPISDFLRSLKKEVREKVLWVLKIIQDMDRVPIKYFKKLTGTDGIWEVKVEYESNIYRLFGFFEKNRLIILTNGYQKKSNKTNRKEIKLAENYRKEYIKNK